jgi:uncharacterized protein (TIGR00255 family)
MLKSMTGYGQAEGNGWLIEIKGVNHRYKEIDVKLPKSVSPLETDIRDMISNMVSRGKVGVFISKKTGVNTGDLLSIHWETAQHYYKELSRMADQFGGKVSFADIVALPGVLTSDAHDLAKDWEILKELLKQAIKSFIGSKEGEGERLKEDIVKRHDILVDLLNKMRVLAADMPGVLRERLHSNIDVLLKDSSINVDEMRIAQEVALLSERSDVTEELVRLEGHLEVLSSVIKEKEESVGRRLDFILQEINREINTIGSKSQLAALSHLVIDAKAEAAKMREQVANIE